MTSLSNGPDAARVWITSQMPKTNTSTANMRKMLEIASQAEQILSNRFELK